MSRPDRAMALSIAVTAVVAVTGIGLARRAARHAVDARHAHAIDAARFPSSLDPMRGYWIWSREMDGSFARRIVSWADMAPRVGPNGWPGCPDNTICTAHGVRRFALGPHDRAHYTTNVHTSSDYQFQGSVHWETPGLARIDFEHTFSCAHPRVNARQSERRWFHFRVVHDELWLGVDSWTEFDLPFARTRPTAEPTHWLVMRRVNRRAFYDTSVFRRCQAEPDVPCDDACFSDALVD